LTEAAVQVGVLRGFRISRGGVVVRLPLASQRLVAFLALHERPLQRIHVAGSLWLDSSEEHASASLRTTIWRLGRHQADLIETSGSEVALAPSVDVDLRHVRNQARCALRQDRLESLSVDDVEGLCVAGDLLPDWYDDWVLMERERFRQLRLHALDSLCEALTAAGRYAAAIEAGHASVAAEPLRESGHRLLVAAYLAEGNPSEAIRQYRVFRNLLRSELGLEPSAHMEALVESLPVR
jgi:DNA-binding SARP family transcriptional activator